MSRFLLTLLAATLAVYAQPGTITTFAGAYPDGLGGPAKDAVLLGPAKVALDASGNIYVAGAARVLKIGADRRVIPFAGTGISGFTGDGGPAAAARISGFPGIAIDAQGNVVLADFGNHRIRRITPDGIIRTIAGNGTAAFSGDGGLASAAQLSSPVGAAFDVAGNLYISDRGNERIRKIGLDGRINTVAGDGTPAYRGDGGPALQASLNRPQDVVLDPSGNLYIADSFNRVVRRVTPDGIISTIAGRGHPDSPQTDPQGRPVPWTWLTALAIDRAGNLYFPAGMWENAGVNNPSSVPSYVMKRDPAGTVTFFAGSGEISFEEYTGPASGAGISSPWGLAMDAQGSLIMALPLHERVAMVDAAGLYSIFAGTSALAGANGPVPFARINGPSDLLFDETGTLNVLEVYIPGIRKILPSGGSQFIYTGVFGGTKMEKDRQGNFYVSDTGASMVMKIDPSGKITPYAGRGRSYGASGSFSGDGGPATEANLNGPTGLLLDEDGSLYIGDSDNHRVRKVSPDGVITTIAGTGAVGSGGDGGPATAAQMNRPGGILIDRDRNIYIADVNDFRIRKITPAGIISTFAGTGQSGFAGDGGPAIQARVAPLRMKMDAAGNMYFHDVGGTRVRKITRNGIITTVAGNGAVGLAGDGGPATAASFGGGPYMALTFDTNGNLFIGDTLNNRIRKVQGEAPFTVTPGSVLFSSTLDGPARQQSLNVFSADSTTRRYQVRSNAPWLSATPDSGTVSSTQTVRLIVAASPKGLAKGTYSGSLTVVDLDSGATVLVPATLTVSGSAQQLRLSQVGFTFTAVQGGSAPPAQSLQVLNIGTGAMPWTAAATTLVGSGWLTVAPASGSSTASSPPPSLTVSVNPANLPAGAYYGQINVAAPGADNSPQSAIVLLRILPVGGIPGPAVDPAGLLFTSTSTTNPAAQSVVVSNASTRAINYTVTQQLIGGTGWLTVPANGSLNAGQSRSIEIAPRSTTLANGVYRATVTFRFQPDNVTRTLDIALVVSPPVTAADPTSRNADAPCIPKQLVAVVRRPGASYQTAAGWPVPMDAAVVDDCGKPLTDGRVTASFSTNDPPVTLLHSGSGIWQATWASRTTGAATNVTIRLAAESADQALAGTSQVIIRSDLNPDQPSINPGAVLNAASFSSTTPVPVGGYVSVFGSRLSKDFQLAPSLPLPNMLGDTSVFLGGKLVPIYFASDGQLNAILPYSIADNTTHQMIVRRGNIPSLPEPVLVASTQPAVFSYDGSGKGQGHIYVARADGTFLADSANPVKSGDVILFYATGLGPVSPPVVEGQPAPADPLALPVNPITVSIQGKPARVVFAGLAPGFAGVYQVNAIAPDGLTADPGATLVVSSGGQPSPVVNMSVTN